MKACVECVEQRMGEAQIVPSFPWGPIILDILIIFFTIAIVAYISISSTNL